jgi:polysaccharide export outer membrane protein
MLPSGCHALELKPTARLTARLQCWTRHSKWLSLARSPDAPNLKTLSLADRSRPTQLSEVLSPVTRALLLLSALAVLLTSGCGGSRMDIDQMTAARSVDLQTIQSVVAPASEYRIGVGDKLDVRVFQVEDLSFEELVVDTSGNIQLPLVGAVRAADRTAGEMASDIARRLAARYLRDPQVTVTVEEAASQKITVDGAVTKPGVYEMRGSTSLLQAVAMAEGPTRIADLTKVAVFRTIDGRRSVALFDLSAIRQGRASDPQVLGEDVIVVDTSRLNYALREVVGALPALSAFAYF